MALETQNNLDNGDKRGRRHQWIITIQGAIHGPTNATGTS